MDHARPDPALLTDGDGIDTLWNVEIARFTDGDFSFGVVFNRPATGTVTLSSTAPVEDQQLSVVSTVINDPDGPASPSPLTFNWQREVDGDWVNIGLPGTTFTPLDDVVGLRLRVAVSFVDRFGVPEEVFSEPTDAVVNVNDVPQGGPVVSTDSPVVGTPMTVDLGTIADDDGLPADLSVQWLRDASTVIVGATDTTYNPTGLDIGHTLRVRVNYTDLHGTAEELLSTSTGTVLPPPAPILERDPTSLAFGTRARLSTPTTQVVTVTNNGNALLTVSGVTITAAANTWSAGQRLRLCRTR